jgi:hypothetical protein
MKTLDPFAAIAFPFFPSSPISAYPINHDLIHRWSWIIFRHLFHLDACDTYFNQAPHTLSFFTTKQARPARHPLSVMLQT